MEWIVIIFLAVVVGYILAESECFGIGECVRCLFDFAEISIKFIRYIFNRSSSESISCEVKEYQDENISSEYSMLIGISAVAVENFKKVGDYYYEGYVKASGTYWKSICRICSVLKGDNVIVKGFQNLTLEVEPIQ